MWSSFNSNANVKMIISCFFFNMVGFQRPYSVVHSHPAISEQQMNAD